MIRLSFGDLLFLVISGFIAVILLTLLVRTLIRGFYEEKRRHLREMLDLKRRLQKASDEEEQQQGLDWKKPN